MVADAVEIERVLGELGETPYASMKEKQDETMFGKSTTDRQLHVLNETLINFFGKGSDGKARPSSTFSVNTNNGCQLCRSKEHTTSACLKLANTRCRNPTLRESMRMKLTLSKWGLGSPSGLPKV